MKKNLIALSFLLFGVSTQLSAQNARFITEGTIEYERSNNMYTLIQKEVTTDNVVSKMRFDEYKNAFPQFKLTKSSLLFSNTASLFSPVKDNIAPDSFFGDNPAANQINTTYIDYSANQQITQKQVFEETFLVKGVIRTVNWKITDETREIAGFNCRRANALIMDSIYVVAFYTDQIPVSGGPESFGGLPGMILGLALPHENVTWFAKLVTDKQIERPKLAPPVKGKIIDDKGLKMTLNGILKNWGSSGQSMLKSFLL